MQSPRFAAETIGELYTQHIATLQDGYSDALATTGFDAVVIHSGLPARQSVFDDQDWPHKPTPAFAHWLPLGKADCAVLVQPGKRPALLTVATEDFWESEAEPEGDHFWSAFDEVEQADPTAFRLPAGRVAFIGEAAERAGQWGVAEDGVNPPALLAALDQVRACKTDYERACIGEANRRAGLGHAAVLEAFVDGDHAELDLHLLYLRVTRQDDSQTPYKNIVAIDENAAVLHHVRYGARSPVQGARSQGTRSLLIDAGATCMGYASDITRTALKGQSSEASGRFAALIRGVEELQAEICRRIEPGMEYEALHDQSHELLAEVLRDIGVATASAEELVASGATRCFFPHGLGHSLGLQVHDVGCRLREPRSDNPFLRNTTVIAPGQVFTIEPGCYFIDSLMNKLRELPVASEIDWTMVDALSHFGGVRIEDNIAVLDGRTSNLTRDNWPDTP